MVQAVTATNPNALQILSCIECRVSHLPCGRDFDPNNV